MKQGLKKKIGPLPAWAWIAAVGMGVVVLYIRNKNAAGTTGTASVGTGGAVLTPTPDFTVPDSFASGGGSAPLLTTDTGIPNPGLTLQDILPYVSYPTGPDPQATSPYDPVGDTVSIISQLREGGLIEGPGSGTGAAAAKPTSHTTKKVTAGFHSGHSRGHEYKLPGGGWVSKETYTRATARATPISRSHTPASTHTTKTTAKKNTKPKAKKVKAKR